MRYYHTDDPSMVQWLANVFATAAENGRKVRIKTNSRDELFIKVGEGAWTAPFQSTLDPYRDASPHANHRVTEAGELLDSDGSHCVTCRCTQCTEDD